MRLILFYFIYTIFLYSDYVKSKKIRIKCTAFTEGEVTTQQSKNPPLRVKVLQNLMYIK